MVELNPPKKQGDYIEIRDNFVKVYTGIYLSILGNIRLLG
jgi:hypothetical protein